MSLKEKLDGAEHLRKHLFEKGFLLTDNNNINTLEFPFYGNWQKVFTHNTYAAYKHSSTNFFSASSGNVSILLLGHAYNPYTMQHSENEILNSLLNEYCKSGYSQPVRDMIDELTGIFTIIIFDNDDIFFENDCSGMQYTCYGYIDNSLYIASHMQLIGDITPIEITTYAKKLIAHRWYKYLMGNYMPGTLTRYNEVKRLICNTVVKYNTGEFTINRIYPNKEIDICKTDYEYDDVISKAAVILKNTMSLIPEKWQNPAISLTGGIDSNTTFAAANGVYEKYKAFSYVSMGREVADAEAARKISDAFGVDHATINVPNNNSDIPDFELYKEIFAHNEGDIGILKDNDTRKKITLIKNEICDVEVKSWISETIRAYAYKYFGKTRFPKKLRPRNYSALYKLFFLNRPLLWSTDKRFKKYIEETSLHSHLYNYDETDLFVWEMMHGGKCSLNIGVMKSCFDITIPYNNRKLLDLLLRIPLQYRISDKHHLDLKKKMNEELFDMNIRVRNENQGDGRAKILGMIYSINSFLPF